MYTAVTILAIGFLSPYLILISQFSLDFSFNSEDFFWALKNSCLQALGSGILSLVLGVWGGLGLLWTSRVLSVRSHFWLEKALLLPSMLPSLFVITACLGFIEPFPFGKLGIVIIHSVMNVGLVSVLFSHICLNKLGSLGALSLIEGATKRQFFRVGILGYLGSDLFYLFMFIFAISMSSFNVPLMVGGSSGTTLEVLIYENLVIDRNWPAAIALSVLQLLLIGGVSLFARTPTIDSVSKSDFRVLELAEQRWGLAFPLGALLMVLIPPLLSVPKGFLQLQNLGIHWAELLIPVGYSALLGLVTGAWLAIMAIAASISFELSGWRRFLMMYIPPGSIFVGIAFFVLGSWVRLPMSLEIIIGLGIVFFAGLFRLAMISPLSALIQQIEVAQVLGAKPGVILVQILLPQVVKQIMFMAGIGSMWACGDFALSSILSTEDFHLALVIKSLASSYRLDAAQLLMFLLYMVALSCFFFWWRLGDVLSRKLNR
jgi:thiamine transport system permease protein